MDNLIPIPFPVLIRRFLEELESRKKVYDLGRHWFFKGDPEFDISVSIHGHQASTPFGPAAGPHTQLAQNILLSWLAGGRFIELKTVQVLDELSIARPCIDMETVGYNIEWSQELSTEQSLEEYVKASMLIEMAKSVGLAPGSLDTIFDMSVGYDLAGIQSPKVQAFIDGMLNAGEMIERLRAQIPEPFSRMRDLDYPSRLSDTVTLSTFHGCPPGEIESIAEYLLQSAGLNVVIKLNPTLLGKSDMKAILHDQLGYSDIVVPDEAFDNDPTWEQVCDMVKRLGQLADHLGKDLGVKFSNTLLVRNHRDFFPSGTTEMYLSGAPLHVLAISLVGRFRKEFGDRFTISFSAGIDADNYADAVALDLKPVSVCTDLLKKNGYGRASSYHKSLRARMKELDAPNIDTFILKAFGHAEAALEVAGLPVETKAACRAALRDGGDLRAVAGKHFSAWVSAACLKNTQTYCERVLGDPRYSVHQTNAPPKKTHVPLSLFDCQTCSQCILVCPNNAVFRFPVPKGDIPLSRLVPDGAGWKFENNGSRTIERPLQIGIFTDVCNECGNCDVICPEDGGVFFTKPNFSGSKETWSAVIDRDSFFIEAVDGGFRIHGRLGGYLFTLENVGEEELRFRGDGFDVTLNPSNPAETARGTSEGAIDMEPMSVMLMLLKGVNETPEASYAGVAVM